MSIATSETLGRATESAAEPTVLVIEPRPGWRALDLRELWEYRDLFYFLVWREVKGRYAQSVLRFGWAVMRPLVNVVVFTLIFGGALGVASDGVPYPLFSYVGVTAWIYFSTALTTCASSLVTNREMITKVYFPRLVIPLSSVLFQLVDLAVALLVLFGLMAWYGISPTPWIGALPLLIAVLMSAAAGAGMWLSALAVQYRDVNYGMAFGIQLLMYLSPVVYPVSAIPEAVRPLYAVNPVVGVIEGLRAALLATKPMPWDLIATSVLVSAALAITGAFYFRRMERTFADVA